jgi:Na+-transporting methylmalonyl-CoA/oxaloacetate decarboxylase gamma subunit
MKKAMVWFAILALLAVTFSFVGCATQEEKKPASAPAPEKAAAPAEEKRPASAAAPTAVHKKTQALFIIERDKNTNVVHYDARLTADGKLDPKEPVIAYWAERAEGSPREELSWIEKKMAYGFTVKPDPSVNGYKMTLVAAPEKQIIVKREKDTVHAEGVINGQPAILEKLHIHATDGLTGPKVHYIEVYGKDLQTGEKLSEKMVPK